MRQSFVDQAVRQARVRGCLLGGALGDALGNPVEFLSLTAIREQYGERGITAMELTRGTGLAVITDDTQMSLFTTEGFRDGLVWASTRGINGAMADLVHAAYLRWLDTQDHPEPLPEGSAGFRSGQLRRERWLYAMRAPGQACLSGLRTGQEVEPFAELTGLPGQVNSNSKGCGTVMRSAPFGFTGDPRLAFLLAGNCAQLTHGHPTGYLAAAAFAEIIAHLVNGESLDAAVLRTLRRLARYRSHEETTEALRKALDLAEEGEASAEQVQRLGEGWIAEEALAIGVYCALVPIAGATQPEVVRERLRLSVNHSGDSDSTGSVCGNLLGARHGDSNLPWDWLEHLEGGAVIARVADEFTWATGQASAW